MEYLWFFHSTNIQVTDKIAIEICEPIRKLNKNGTFGRENIFIVAITEGMNSNIIMRPNRSITGKVFISPPLLLLLKILLMTIILEL